MNGAGLLNSDDFVYFRQKSRSFTTTNQTASLTGGGSAINSSYNRKKRRERKKEKSSQSLTVTHAYFVQQQQQQQQKVSYPLFSFDEKCSTESIQWSEKNIQESFDFASLYTSLDRQAGHTVQLTRWSMAKAVGVVVGQGVWHRRRQRRAAQDDNKKAPGSTQQQEMGLLLVLLQYTPDD